MIVFLAAVVAVCGLTWAVGWWGVVVAAAAVGALWWSRPAIAWIAALAALTGWATLLLANLVGGRFGALADALGGVMRIPSSVLVIATLLFAGLLGWSAAVVGEELGRWVQSLRGK